MSRRPDDLFVSCPVLSKREREQNRSLHRCSRTGRTALEQLEQLNSLPISTCSRDLEQDRRKTPLFRASEKATCSKGSEQLKTGWKAASHPYLISRSMLPIRPARNGTDHLINRKPALMGKIILPGAEMSIKISALKTVACGDLGPNSPLPNYYRRVFGRS
jgi:hypothetical protein